MQMTDYRSFGRSGLIVSPLTLGTMTFGAGRWGSDLAEARGIFDAYVAAGGNIIDTADVYSGGESERMLGQFVTESGLRDRLVLSKVRASPVAGPSAAWRERRDQHPSRDRGLAAAPRGRTGSTSTGCMSGTAQPTGRGAGTLAGRSRAARSSTTGFRTRRPGMSPQSPRWPRCMVCRGPSGCRTPGR